MGGDHHNINPCVQIIFDSYQNSLRWDDKILNYECMKYAVQIIGIIFKFFTNFKYNWSNCRLDGTTFFL